MAPNIKLIPGVKLRRYRKDDGAAAEADEAFRKVREDVLRRDNMTCLGCGMQTKKAKSRPSGGFDVHHVDDDHTNNNPDNLATLCPFCHAVFHIGNAGNRHAGSIIWLPEVSQADLNIVCHTLFILIHQGDLAAKGHSDRIGKVEGSSEGDTGEGRDQREKREKAIQCGKEARDRYEALAIAYADSAVRHLGPGMDSAEYFGKSLAWFGRKHPKAYEARARFMSGARFLPRYEAWVEQVEHWRRSSNYPHALITAEMLPLMLESFKRDLHG